MYHCQHSRGIIISPYICYYEVVTPRNRALLLHYSLEVGSAGLFRKLHSTVPRILRVIHGVDELTMHNIHSIGERNVKGRTLGFHTGTTPMQNYSLLHITS